MPASQRKGAPLAPAKAERRGVLRAFLQLIRLPNLFTAAADPLAAAIAAAGLMGAAVDWGTAVAAAWVGIFVYAGGVVLNDYVDYQEDRRERPERPLPSGQISPSEALAIAVCFFVIALGLALITLPAGSLGIVLALLGSVMLYNGWAKHVSVAGPLAMGACRGLNVFVGLWTIAGAFEELWWLGVLSTLHFAAYTYLGEAENKRLSTAQVLAVLLAVSAVGGVLIWRLDGLVGRLVIAAYAAINWEAGIRLLRDPSLNNVHRAVKRGILSHVLIHVGVVTALAAHPAYGLIPLLLLAAGFVTARHLKMT